jgi:hypothetical protein
MCACGVCIRAGVRVYVCENSRYVVRGRGRRRTVSGALFAVADAVEQVPLLVLQVVELLCLP